MPRDWKSCRYAATRASQRPGRLALMAVATAAHCCASGAQMPVPIAAWINGTSTALYVTAGRRTVVGYAEGCGCAGGELVAAAEERHRDGGGEVAVAITVVRALALACGAGIVVSVGGPVAVVGLVFSRT